MEKSEKDNQIVRQSSLKSLKDICDLLKYEPQSLSELLRLNDVISSYALFGTQKEVKDNIKRFDQHLKNNTPIPINVGYKQKQDD